MTPKHFHLLILLLGIFPANIYAEDTTTDSGSSETTATSDTTDSATTDADTTTTDSAPADDGTTADEPAATEEVAANVPETQDVGITAEEDPVKQLPYLYDTVMPEGPIKEKGTYWISLYTGSVTYAYPIDIPTGTNDLMPSISLSYSSMGVKGHAGLACLGWSLLENYILRDVNNTPEDTSDDEFDLILNGNKYDPIY